MNEREVLDPPTRRRGRLGRLLHGETNVDFVGRTKIWFAISGVLLLIGIGALIAKQLNLGIDFEGGAVFEVPTDSLSVTDARDALAPLGLENAKVQELSDADSRLIRVQTETLDPDRADEVREALATAAGVDADEVSSQEVGPSWGDEITQKARNALIVFLVVISLYIWVRFELKMAIPTLAALVHDILMTIGVYALFGFEVTPATVIALLTILGYSIYDGIVVFDKVAENTRLVSASGRMTYGDMVNLSLNQTLMRSLNTSITALIPILSLLLIGSTLLGAETLQEFGLALLVGLASGAYSSIFIASPMLALLKEREPRYRDVRRRMDVRETRLSRAEAEAQAAVVPPSSGAPAPDEEGARVRAAVGAAGPKPSRPTTAIPPRPRKKGRKR